MPFSASCHLLEMLGVLFNYASKIEVPLNPSAGGRPHRLALVSRTQKFEESFANCLAI